MSLNSSSSRDSPVWATTLQNHCAIGENVFPRLLLLEFLLEAVLTKFQFFLWLWQAEMDWITSSRSR